MLNAAEQALVAERSEAMKTCLVAASNVYREMTGRNSVQFCADSLVHLADHCGLMRPREAAALLRAMADLVDCYDVESYQQRKDAVAHAFNALMDKVEVQP